MNYTFADQLANAVLSAANLPTGTDYGPTMVYKNGDRNDFLIALNVEELARAKSNGYTETPSPQWAEGFPQSWVEPMVSGGKSDRRRVLLHDPAELEKFNQLTEDGEGWVRDDEHQFAGRGTNLDELVAEREELLKQELHDRLHRK